MKPARRPWSLLVYKEITDTLVCLFLLSFLIRLVISQVFYKCCGISCAYNIPCICLHSDTTGKAASVKYNLSTTLNEPASFESSLISFLFPIFPPPIPNMSFSLDFLTSVKGSPVNVLQGLVFQLIRIALATTLTGIRVCFFVFRILFARNLHTQHGAGTPNPEIKSCEIKSCTPYLLSQSGAPGIRFVESITVERKHNVSYIWK